MHPYRPLYQLAPPRESPPPSRDLPIAFAILAGVSAIELAATWHTASAQAVLGASCFVAGLAGVFVTWRDARDPRRDRRRISWPTSSSSS